MATMKMATPGLPPAKPTVKIKDIDPIVDTHKDINHPLDFSFKVLSKFQG